MKCMMSLASIIKATPDAVHALHALTASMHAITFAFTQSVVCHYPWIVPRLLATVGMATIVYQCIITTLTGNSSSDIQSMNTSIKKITNFKIWVGIKEQKSSETREITYHVTILVQI